MAFTLGDLFTGKLVRLAAKGPEYKEAAARWTNDAEYMRQYNFDPAVLRPESYYDDAQKNEDNSGRHFEFALRTLDDDKMIGFVGLDVTWNHQSAWMWIGIGDAEDRGKGYGTDGVRLILGYAFCELGLYRVTLGVFAYNLRAIRAYEKAGFVHEGVHRAIIYRDGQRYDSLVMGMIRPDWEASVNG